MRFVLFKQSVQVICCSLSQQSMLTPPRESDSPGAVTYDAQQ